MDFVSLACLMAVSLSLECPFAKSHLGDSGRTFGEQRGKIMKTGKLTISCSVVHLGKIQESSGTNINPMELEISYNIEIRFFHLTPAISMQYVYET